MKIRTADHSGICFGVCEAIRKTEELISDNTGKSTRIYTCGPLIHNRAVTDDLQNRGVEIIENLSSAEPGSVIVIRSHGEPESFYNEAAQSDYKIVDATCPFVAKIHELVLKAQLAGRNIVVIGDVNHPEVKGIVGWAGKNCEVINSIDEAVKIDYDNITLVAQTTITGSLWDSIANYLTGVKSDVIPLRTICNATDERQKSCEKIALESDLMIVIGDRNSANSKKLLEIAQKNCKKTFFVENINDLPLKQIELCDRIGVAAGASTPERIIKEVISTMSEAITEMKETQIADAIENSAEEPIVKTPDDEATTEASAAPEIEPEEEETEKAKETPEEAPLQEDTAATEVQEEELHKMDDFMAEIDKQMILPNRGEIVEGEIVQVTNREIVVNLRCKKDGIIPMSELILEEGRELTETYKAGDIIQAKVIKTDDGEGNILLSKKKVEINEHWDEINEALDNKTVVNAKVVKEVKGGVIAVYKEVSGFIPMSQLSDRYVEKADEFIGKVLPVKVSRVDQKRNKAVFSHKAYLSEEKQRKVQEIWNALNIGDVVEGTVMRFTDYGAFVDIGGLDGLLHISEISWGKLKHPQEALKIGERIDVKILSINTEKGKISLGLKQTQPEPWSVIDDKYKTDQIITGNVVQIKEYGAFVELEPGLDGLVHISEIAHKRVTNIADELSVGQTVQAKILDIDKERKRISLSIKETIEPSLMEEGKTAPSRDENEEIADEAEGVAEKIVEKTTEFIEEVKENIDELKEKAKEVKEAAEDILESVTDKAEDIIEDIKEKIED